MHAWKEALLLGTISGLSLPLGAVLGIIFTPVRDAVCAGWMAFGAGALLFAVTVELYGHALRELELGHSTLFHMLATVAGAFVGALFYLAVNRWLETIMGEDFIEDVEIESGEQSPLSLSEATPLFAKPGKGHNTLNMSVNTSIGEEKRRWEQISTPGGARSMREDSFSRNTSFAVSDDFSIKSRGRDKVINRMTCASLHSNASVSSASRSVSPKKGPLAGLTPGSPQESIIEVDPLLARKGNTVAFALFLGILVDGVPEGLLMGFLAAEGHLSAVLIISLLIANFPEAFSSASLMRQGGVSRTKIVCMWLGLCLLVGGLAGAACFALTHYFPSYPHGEHLPEGLIISVAVIEGLTGGAMIACIATVMLPEAFHRADKDGLLIASSGFLCTSGFLVAVVLKALEHHYSRDEPEGVHGHYYIFGHELW